MITPKLEEALNEQIANEAKASFQYLAMSSWCEREGLTGAAAFFQSHAVEEHEHMMKIFHFINDVKGHAIVPKVDKPKTEFDNIQSLCFQGFEHEQDVTKSIYKLMQLAVKEDDFVTAEFLRYFIEEQKEEENLFQKALDKIKLIGTGEQSLYYIDQELSKLNLEHSKVD